MKLTRYHRAHYRLRWLLADVSRILRGWWRALMEDEVRGWGVMRPLAWLIPLVALAVTAVMWWCYGP